MGDLTTNQAAAASSRERILDAAEQLFSEQGISGTSLRALTRAADVNLASVHYYFGSKEALLDAVIDRRAKPVTAQRLFALETLRSSGEDLEIEAILEAFVFPPPQCDFHFVGTGAATRKIDRADRSPAT